MTFRSSDRRRDPSRRLTGVAACLLAAALLAALWPAQASRPPRGPQPPDSTAPVGGEPVGGETPSATTEKQGWRLLFDGDSLDGWKPSEFGGQSEVYVEDGVITLDFGSPLNGITYAGEFPTTDYELRLEARRDAGGDFFCGLTFPVGQEHCTLIVGGWGGALVGLSSIDQLDASQNATRQYLPLRNGRWYKVRIAVHPDRILVWLDDKEIINQPRSDHQFSTRPEVNRSKPLGLAAFETRAHIRRVQWKPLENFKR